MRILFFIATFLSAFSANVCAATTYVCHYPTYSDTEGKYEAKNFNLTFLVDEDSKKSYMVGELGSSEVSYIPQKNALSFIEITDTGNVMSTAIDEKLNSVHSRNTLILGSLTPSQYYGTCIVKH